MLYHRFKLFILLQSVRGHGERDLWGHNMKSRIMHLEVTLAHEECCEHITIHSFLHYVKQNDLCSSCYSNKQSKNNSQ